MWKIAVLIIGLSGYCLAGPVGLKRNMPIVQQRDDAVATETESAVDNADPNEMLIMSSLNLPSNATSIRADITDGFSCENKTYGYYADVDNDCQIFHVCLPVTYADGKENTFRWSFICPEETIFSQDSFTCMRPDDMTISCEESYQYYELNRNFGMMESESESESDKVVNNEAASENIASSETVLEAVHAPQVKPVLPELQQQEEEQFEVKPVGQPRPIKPNRRKPVVSFAAQKKPLTAYPLRKMPQGQTELNEKPVESAVEDVKIPAEPVEEEIKPTVQKFSRRPVVPIRSNTLKDKIQNSKPETMIGVRTELFNQKRKRPTMFNKKPVEAQEEAKEEELKIESQQPEKQSFSPVELQMSNTNTETEMADSEIQASETNHVVVKPVVENQTQQMTAEIERNEKPVQVLEAFEEIPAVISEVVETANAEDQAIKNKETIPVAGMEENDEEIPAANEAPEDIQIVEKEKQTAEEEMQASAESEAVKDAEAAQTIEETQVAEETPKSEDKSEVEDTQSLSNSAEETQTVEEAQTAEEDQAVKENLTIKEQSAENTQFAQEVPIVEEVQAADEVHAADTVQAADDKPEAVKDVSAEEVSVPAADETPENIEKNEETKSVEGHQNGAQLGDGQVKEENEESQTVEQNQESEEPKIAEQTSTIEEPQANETFATMEEEKTSQESNTLEENTSVEENNTLKEEGIESNAEPAIVEENSEEVANLAPVQTIEEMESEKPAEAPETVQATDEMSQPDIVVQQMYEDLSDGKQSIGGFKPVDPIMAHEAEQLIADFINTLRKNDFTNETPGMNREHPVDEMQEGVAEVEDSKKVENSEAINETNEHNEDRKQEAEPQISETLTDSVENTNEDVQNNNEMQEPTQEDEENQNQIKSLENQSVENMEETQKSEELNTNYINMPQPVYQIPVQVITTPLEEVSQEQIKQTAVEPVQTSENSQEKAQDDAQAVTMAGYKPLSIDDIVELVKERLDHMPKDEMETPMQLEQVLGSTQEVKTPIEDEKLKEKGQQEQQQESKSEEQQLQQQQEETKQSEEEIVMPIYQRFIQPLQVDAGVPTDNIESAPDNQASDANEADVQEKTSRSYSSRSIMKKLDPRKRRFLFKTESS